MGTRSSLVEFWTDPASLDLKVPLSPMKRIGNSHSFLLLAIAAESSWMFHTILPTCLVIVQILHFSTSYSLLCSDLGSLRLREKIYAGTIIQ